MNDKKLSKIYAEAIFKMAKEKDIIFSVLEMLDVLVKHVEEDYEFRDFLSYPIIENDDKKKIINVIYEDLKGVPRDVLDYLIDKNRLVDIIGIRNEYLNMYHDLHNQLIVTAIFPKKLTEEQKERLLKKLEKLKNKKILLNIEIDESLIGGGIIKINDEVIDGSVKSQILELKNMF